VWRDADQIASKLAEDVVRNGEGTNHVIQVTVKNAPSKAMARDLGRAVVNSPLFKCAIAGNDPNVGRLLAAVGKFVGNNDLPLSLDACRCGGWAMTWPSCLLCLCLAETCGRRWVIFDLRLVGSGTDGGRAGFWFWVVCRMMMGGKVIFERREFKLDPVKEEYLVKHMKDAQIVGPLKASAEMAVVKFPPHERNVEVEVDLGQGSESITVFGSDLTYDYVTENADYRS
jgi:glutamate N-acetyltransferase / amino-acid N-acetyltransferase